jgi:hypothetical protein
VSDPTHGYFARCKCGCGRVVAAHVDRDEHKKDVARFTNKLIKDGYAVERGTIEEIRSMEWGCIKDTKETP